MWALPFLFFFGRNSDAQQFNPTISIDAYYTKAFSENEIGSGLFTSSNRPINFAVTAKNKFKFRKGLFLSSGISYHTFKSTFSGHNQIHILHNKPDPFIWTRGFDHLSIPLHFGKTHKTRKGNELEFYIGWSGGIAFNTFSKNELNRTYPTNWEYFDHTYLVLTDTHQLGKPQFFHTLDLGIYVQHFQKIREFTIGFVGSYQLNKIKIGSFHGEAQNRSQNQKFDYRATLYQNPLNVGVSLRYSFLKDE